MKRIIAYFVLFNAVLFIIVWAFLFQPVVAAIGRVRGVVAVQEAQLARYARYADAYEYNLAFIETWDDLGLVPQSEMVLVLGEVVEAANLLGLRVISFHGAEAVGYDEFLEKRVVGVYEGQVDALVDFMEMLDFAPVVVTGVQMDFFCDNMATLRVGFSIVGVKE